LPFVFKKRKYQSNLFVKYLKKIKHSHGTKNSFKTYMRFFRGLIPCTCISVPLPQHQITHHPPTHHYTLHPPTPSPKIDPMHILFICPSNTATNPNLSDQPYAGPAASCCVISGTHSICLHYLIFYNSILEIIIYETHFLADFKCLVAIAYSL
jgi:hypothetical protein